MKKLVAALVLASSMVAFAQSEQASDSSGDFGIGYQGIFLGNFFNGVSLRYAPDETPIIGQLTYARYAGDIEGMDGSINMFQGRLAYVLTEREYSKFYVGAKLGYMWIDIEEDKLVDGFTYGPMFGTEFRFAEIPELGFNFDVGYDFNTLDVDGLDVDVSGINVTFGCHYYF
jgi:hypothetical protein